MLYERQQQSAQANRTIHHQGTSGKSLPAVPFLQKPAALSSQPVLQGYFTHYGNKLTEEYISQIKGYLEKNYSSLAETFGKLAAKTKSYGTISDWLKTNEVTESVKTIMGTELSDESDEDDNISVFSDFEEDDKEKWEGLKKEKYHPKHETQFKVFKHIRNTLKEKSQGEGLTPGGLTNLFESVSKFNGYDQSTFGYARKEGVERTKTDDRLFGTKLTTVPMRYLSKTLTNKKEYDWNESGKSTTNEKHFEKGMSQTIKKRKLNPEDYEIMISRERCEFCKEDSDVNEFGHIHAKGEDEE
ncbi:hypothetical protein ACFGVR_11020 [Mucilaginibacter sp. AW1-3]